MRLSDDFDEDDKKAGLPVVYMMLGGIAFVIVVIVIVVAANDKGIRRRPAPAPQTVEDEQTVVAQGDGSGLTADDLDFWNMYKEDEKKVSENSVIRDKSYEERLKELEEEEAEKAKAEDLSEGGTKTKVIRPDGTEQWIMINAFIEKNPYKEEGFVYADPMMKYYAEGKNISYQGLMLDESDEAVDFALLKEDGISFVMLRAGYRGYESGTITEDKMFEDYLEGALGAEMMVGVYFESAAISQEEAVEEGQFVTQILSRIAYRKANPDAAFGQVPGAAALQGQAQAQDTAEGHAIGITGDTTEINVNGQQVTAPGQEQTVQPVDVHNSDIVYPIAIKMGQPQNHNARTDTMPKTSLSQIANAFLDTVQKAGYKGIVWGDKYWLLRRMDLTQLTLNTEILLEQNEELPDYPYLFSIWQYQSDGSLSGLKKDARMMISFVDYKQQ